MRILLTNDDGFDAQGLRILRKIAEGNTDQLGDTSTLLDPAVVREIVEHKETVC